MAQCVASLDFLSLFIKLLSNEYFPLKIPFLSVLQVHYTLLILLAWLNFFIHGT
jgi:hypothetical protein